jgi:hypothetical protein
MLDDKGRVEAERLGLDIVLDPLESVSAAPGSGRFAWALPKSPNRMSALLSWLPRK